MALDNTLKQVVPQLLEDKPYKELLSAIIEFMNTDLIDVCGVNESRRTSKVEVTPYTDTLNKFLDSLPDLAHFTYVEASTSTLASTSPFIKLWVDGQLSTNSFNHHFVSVIDNSLHWNTEHDELEWNKESPFQWNREAVKTIIETKQETAAAPTYTSGYNLFSVYKGSDGTYRLGEAISSNYTTATKYYQYLQAAVDWIDSYVKPLANSTDVYLYYVGKDYHFLVEELLEVFQAYGGSLTLPEIKAMAITPYVCRVRVVKTTTIPDNNALVSYSTKENSTITITDFLDQHVYTEVECPLTDAKVLFKDNDNNFVEKASSLLSLEAKVQVFFSDDTSLLAEESEVYELPSTIHTPLSVDSTQGGFIVSDLTGELLRVATMQVAVQLYLQHRGHVIWKWSPLTDAQGTISYFLTPINYGNINEMYIVSSDDYTCPNAWYRSHTFSVVDDRFVPGCYYIAKWLYITLVHQQPTTFIATLYELFGSVHHAAQNFRQLCFAIDQYSTDAMRMTRATNHVKEPDRDPFAVISYRPSFTTPAPITLPGTSFKFFPNIEVPIVYRDMPVYGLSSDSWSQYYPHDIVGSHRHLVTFADDFTLQGFYQHDGTFSTLEIHGEGANLDAIYKYLKYNFDITFVRDSVVPE